MLHGELELGSEAPHIKKFRALTKSRLTFCRSNFIDSEVCSLSFNSKKFEIALGKKFKKYIAAFLTKKYLVLNKILWKCVP